MSDRCISLRPWESLALLAGATVVVRPVVPALPSGAIYNQTFPQALKPKRGIWVLWDDDRHTCHWRRSEVFPGDTLIGREAWCEVEWTTPTGDRVERKVLYGADSPGLSWSPAAGDRWRSPTVLPAALARHRYPVVSVEACELSRVPDETWAAAGFGVLRRDALIGLEYTSHVRTLAHEQWLETHGPGSWAGWVWVIRIGR
jgi:hypothetical protein